MRARALIALLTLYAAPARAQLFDASAEYLSPAALLAIGNRGFGAGLEGAYTVYPDATMPLAVGAVLQTQLYTDGSVRIAAALSGNFLGLGTELGVAWRSGNARHDAVLGLHLGYFLSLGYATFGFRATVPFREAARAWALEQSFTLALRYFTRVGPLSRCDPYVGIAYCP